MEQLSMRNRFPDRQQQPFTKRENLDLEREITLQNVLHYNSLSAQDLSSQMSEAALLK